MDAEAPDPFKGAKFDVEHAFGMYADGYCLLPADALYNDEILAEFQELTKSSHIYLIGLLPLVEFNSAREEDGQIIFTVSMLGRRHDLSWPLPPGLKLCRSADGYFIENKNGARCGPTNEMILKKINDSVETVKFEVQYIGQAFGKDGSRNAIDRLRKHETLQKISLLGVPEGFHLSIMLIEIQPNNQLFTVFNPWAENNDDAESSARIDAGFDKMYGTSEQEQVALYEASLIRYFMPKFNTIFKNSFPSTNHKVLQDCYAKDFAAIVAEICFDNLPFRLCSEVVEPSLYHTVKHDLHDDSARRIFFHGEDDD
jgi:hypothetical protein